MNNVHCARNPAPGVKVLHVPRKKIEGLSLSVQRNMRKISIRVTTKTGGITFAGEKAHATPIKVTEQFMPIPEYLRSGPVPLGIRSLNTLVEPWIKPTRPAFQHRTPGKKMSTGTSSKGPANMVFQGKIESRHQVDDRQAASALKRISRHHAGLLGNQHADASDWAEYRVARQKFVDRFPFSNADLRAIEIEHHKSIIPGRSGYNSRKNYKPGRGRGVRPLTRRITSDKHRGSCNFARDW